MSIFQQLNISGSALSAQRLRMDVISSNIANATSTRGQLVNGEWVPYRRKMVEMAPAGPTQFNQFLQMAMGEEATGHSQGVMVTKIDEDQTPFKQIYDPNHPDADKNGYVSLPNVDLAKEMVDLLSATRAYEANVTAFNAGKNMALKALDIGK